MTHHNLRKLSIVLAALALPIAVYAQTKSINLSSGLVEGRPAPIVRSKVTPPLPPGYTAKANAPLLVFSLAQVDPAKVDKVLPFVKNVTADANGFFEATALPAGQNYIVYNKGLQMATVGQTIINFLPNIYSSLPTMAGRVVSVGPDVKVVACDATNVWACK